MENFIQAIFNTLRDGPPLDFSRESLVVGGDGRYYNREAIQRIVRMAAAHGFGRVLVGRGGLLSTPAMSAVIRRRQALGGLILSASHNPGGPQADFGIKYNMRNGGPAPERVTGQVYEHSRRLSSYHTVEWPDIDLERPGSSHIGPTRVEVIDPLADYTDLMQEVFDFDTLRSLFQTGFRLRFDAMHGVTGPYARHILADCLGAARTACCAPLRSKILAACTPTPIWSTPPGWWPSCRPVMPRILVRRATETATAT